MPHSAEPSPTSASTSPETEFDRFFRLSLDLLCVAGLDGYFKRVNPSWTRVLGWTEEELLRRPVHEFMHPDDRERTLRAREGLARGVPVRHLENRYLCKDGSHRWLSWQSITEPGGPLVFAVARDITEQRHLEHERLVLGKLESTGLLAAGIAHDFNNLFAGLMLNLDLLRLSGPLAPLQRDQLDQALASTRAASALTRQLLAFAGNEAANRHTREIGSLLHEAAALVFRDGERAWACDVAADLRAVRVNETQISQVFRGLLLNAREATQAGDAVRIEARNTAARDPQPATLAAGDYVRVSIADEGAGIAPEIMPRIFDPYFSTKERGAAKGMGLGLTICRAVIERHHGVMTVESTPGQGTIVTCWLPAA